MVGPSVDGVLSVTGDVTVCWTTSRQRNGTVAPASRVMEGLIIILLQSTYLRRCRTHYKSVVPPSHSDRA
jgi:hypothetical protein